MRAFIRSATFRPLSPFFSRISKKSNTQLYADLILRFSTNQQSFFLGTCLISELFLAPLKKLRTEDGQGVNYFNWVRESGSSFHSIPLNYFIIKNVSAPSRTDGRTRMHKFCRPTTRRVVIRFLFGCFDWSFCISRFFIYRDYHRKASEKYKSKNVFFLFLSAQLDCLLLLSLTLWDGGGDVKHMYV